MTTAQKQAQAAGLDLIEDDPAEDDPTLAGDNPGGEGGDKNEPEDRGDLVEPPVDKAALKELVKTAPVDDEGDDAPGTDDRGDKGAARIPKARFDEVNNKLKEVLAENARLKEGGKPAAVADAEPAPQVAAAKGADVSAVTAEIKDLRKEYNAALMDGDTDKAAELSEQIDEKVMQVAEERALTRIASQSVATSMQQETNKVLADYPFLDTADGADALAAVIAARDRRIAEGMAPALALRAAADAIAPKFAPADGGEDENPNKGLQDKEARADTRSAEALRRGAADSQLQPPALQAGQGNRTTAEKALDPTKMSEEQFEALTPAEKKRLRGD